MKLFRTAVLFVGLMIVAACAPMTIKGDPAREAQAQHLLVLTIAGDLDGVVADMPPELDSPTTRAQLAEVRAKLPKTPPPAGRTVSFTRFVGTGSEVYTLVRLYEFPATVIVTQTQMTKRADGRWVVANFTFNSATPEQLKANDFTLSAKTPVHYAVLAAMVAVASFIVVTVGFALYRRRWGWAICSLFGLVAFQLNWATGAWALQPLQFYFLGAAFVRAASPFAAWVFTVAFPLGAVLFWALRKNTPKPPKTPKKGKAARQPFVSTPDDFSPITAPVSEPTGTSRPPG